MDTMAGSTMIIGPVHPPFLFINSVDKKRKGTSGESKGVIGYILSPGLSFLSLLSS